MGISKKGLIFGRHPIIEALREGRTLEKILIQKGANGEQIRTIYHEALRNSVPIQSVPVEKLRRYPVDNHQGVIALLSPIEYQDLDNIIFSCFEKGIDPLILILDSITDVRNFGAITRTAECMGVHAILVPNKGSALLNADAVKTSAGALFKVPICRCASLVDQVRTLKNSGLKIITCSEKATYTINKVDLNSPAAIVFGSEEFGISKEIIKIADDHVKIPLTGTIGSLNVSVATGMVLYEIRRQRDLV